MDQDFKSHTENGVNVKTENLGDGKNIIESNEPNALSYSDLSNKIINAQTLIKDAIKLSQQIILYSDCSTSFSSNNGTSQFFDNVAGPLVNAVDLLTSSLKALEDNIQFEEKYEVDCTDAFNQDSKKIVEKSLNHENHLNECFVKVENCRKRDINNIKSENPRSKKRKYSPDSSYNSFYLDEDISSDYNDFGYDDNDDSIDNNEVEKNKTTRKSNSSSKVNYNEETNDWTDEEDKKDIKSESVVKILENSESNDSDWNEDLDGDLDYDKESKVNKLKKKRKLRTSNNFQELKCDRCDFTTTNKTLHSYHKKGWLQWRNCPWCPAAIRNGLAKNDNKTAEQYFEEHLKLKHKGLCKTAKHGFICRACKQEFPSVPEYDNHLTEQHNLGFNYHCKTNCGFTSTDLQLIRNHLKEEHMICRLCRNRPRFVTVKLFNEHNADKHTPASCNICNEEVKSKHKLAYHMKNVHNSVPESDWRCCTICGKSFPKHSLLRHMKRVHGNNDEEARCDVCDFVTTSEFKLQVHKKTNHAAETFLCHLCPFVGSKYQLSAHRNYKHAENKVSCPDCDLSFPTNSKLKSHILTKHTEERVVVCPEPGCGHEVKTNFAIKLHIDKVHKGIRWPCTKCDFVGDYRSSLNTHIKVVHEDLGFKCDKCEFTTYKKSLLLKHLFKVHQEGEDILKSCDLCDYKAINNYLLNMHKESVHKGESYQCFICTSISATRRAFYQHLLRRHKTSIKRSEFKQHLIINK